MRFLLDQSTEARIATFLAAQGHDATRIARDYPPGLPDDQVLALARQEERVLITNDNAFGDLVFERRWPHAGVILFRLSLNATTQQKIAALKHSLRLQQPEPDQFLVVRERGVRVRRSS